MVKEQLARLFHNRWAVPVLAELDRGQGAKFITLIKRLGVGRDTLSRTLKALDKRGWAGANPGHGHPMRPEYILTERGRVLGPACSTLMEALDRAGLASVGLKKWSMPVIHAIGEESRHFNEIGASLPDATPRALTQSLKELGEAGAIRRTLVDGYPPRTVYENSPAAGALLPALQQLASALQHID